MGWMRKISLCLLLFGFTACSRMPDLGEGIGDDLFGQSLNLNSSRTIELKVHQGNNQVFPVSGQSTVPRFTGFKSQNYSLNPVLSNLQNGESAQIQITNLSIPNPVTVTHGVSGSPVSWTPIEAGDYEIKVKVMKGNELKETKSFTGVIQCSNSTFTAGSLNSSAITVTGTNNLYTYSISPASNAQTVISTANGIPPYQCAWDLSGIGFISSPFTPCGSPRTDYSSYVGPRRIALIVKDGCNVSHPVAKDLTLSTTPLTSPGNNFIIGNVSDETGIADIDPRIKGVHYQAQNNNPLAPSDLQVSFGTSHPFTFNIQAFHKYNSGQNNHAAYGIKLEIGGITGTLSGSGTLDASAANVTRIEYHTDQAGDHKPKITLVGTTCTSSLSVKKDVIPISCGPTSTGGEASWTHVEVWGTYTCTNVSTSGSNDPGSATISGSFDGIKNHVYYSNTCVYPPPTPGPSPSPTNPSPSPSPTAPPYTG
jgi:hypothetical protein